MRFTMCKSSVTKARVDVEAYKEELLKREIEKAIKDGHVYGVALKKAKRFRSAFTTEQVNYLESEFRKYPYVGNARRKDVATVLNIPERAVKIWFQNRRMKEKKDTTNKESKAGKSTGFKSVINMRGVKSTANVNNASLQRLTSQASQISASKEANYDNDCIASNSTTSNELYCNSTVLINPASTTTEIAPVSASKTETKEVKSETKIRAAESTVEDQQKSPFDYFQQKIESQNLISPEYPLSSSIPEDLSFKSNPTNMLSQPEMKFNNSETPVYLKGFYTQPYLPPSNMVWRPLNLAPMVPAPVSIVSTPGSAPHMIKKNCSCDCHKLYSTATPMLLQNSPGSNLQYVVTAVPFQNSSPKF